jgi:galactose mutarotase-like enzyme
MAVHRWLLCDAKQRHYAEPQRISSAAVSTSSSTWSIETQTLRGGRQDGVDVIEVDNGAMRFVVVPTRGMNVWKCWLGSRELSWPSPVEGPVHPSFVPLEEASGAGWLEGFDEVLTRCGLHSNGPPEFAADGRLTNPLHGRIANSPAHWVEASYDEETQEIAIEGIVCEQRFGAYSLQLTSRISTRLGETALRVNDRVANRTSRPADCQLLYHINFGFPLLDEGSQLIAPVARLTPRDESSAAGLNDWDRYSVRDETVAEEVYFLELAADSQENTQALLKNGAGHLGVSVRFNVRQLPYFTLWKDRLGAENFRVTGLEPGTNYPNQRTLESRAGRVVSLGGAEEKEFEVMIQFHAGATAVKQACDEIASLQSSLPPRVV